MFFRFFHSYVLLMPSWRSTARSSVFCVLLVAEFVLLSLSPIMAETNAVANASTKSSNNVHPHYFTSFQNYCCGPRSRSTVSPANKDLLPIPDSIKKKAVEIVTRYNKVINERLSELVTCTSEIPHEFLDGDHPIDAQRYLVDRAMFKIMNDARVVNWLPSLKKMYPIRTSGERRTDEMQQTHTCMRSSVFLSRKWKLSPSCCSDRHDWWTWFRSTFA